MQFVLHVSKLVEIDRLVNTITDRKMIIDLTPALNTSFQTQLFKSSDWGW